MNGLGGLNKSDNGVVIGLVQLQLPIVETKADLTARTGRVVELVAAEVCPDLVPEARLGWGVENNPYKIGHRGYVAVDGTAFGFPKPTRRFSEKEPTQ
ncbi:MAG: hypothetical protein ACSHXD_17215 [Marinosulfonomonas sp.]